MNTVRSFPARQHPHPLHHSKAREAPILRLHFSDSDGVHHRACLTSTLRIDPAELPNQLQDDILLRLRGLLRLMDLDLQGVQHISSLSPWRCGATSHQRHSAAAVAKAERRQMPRHKQFALEGLIHDASAASVPMGSQGCIRLHYLDDNGNPQETVLLTTRPMAEVLAMQERVRAGLVRYGMGLGCEVLSVQVELLGARSVRLPWSTEGKLLAFPGTAGCLDRDRS